MTSRFSAWAASMTIAAASALIFPAAASTTAAALPWCAIDSMSLSTGAPGSPGSFDQIHFAVVLTNISSQSCALQGYPGVDLLGPDDPTDPIVSSGSPAWGSGGSAAVHTMT